MRTAVGRDHQSDVMASTASTGTGLYAPANWIGLTANSTAPADADTTLTGEITTGTLARAQAAYAHTTGSSSYTLTKTFTSDQTITLAKLGVFTAATAGRMTFESLIPSPPALVSGDQVALTQTVTL